MNCHCIDPTKYLVLNPDAWSNPTDGQWGTSAPYYNDFRYERRPAESMSLGRIFRFKESIALTVRMNFQNIFNGTQLSNPTASNPLAPVTCTGGTGAVCANPATAGKLTVHHFVDHGVELVLRDIDAIEATREIYILVTAQHIDLADEAPQVVGGHPARIRGQITSLHEPDTEAGVLEPKPV